MDTTAPDAPPQGATSSFSPVPIAIACFVMALAVVGIIVGVADSDDDGGSGGGGGSGSVVSGPVAVEMTEFAIDDASVPSGGSLEVTNAGAVVHNLAVEGEDLITPDLVTGESATLDLAALGDGTYTLFCAIPGHRDAGMISTLTIGGDAGGGHSSGGHDDMDYQAMTDAMLASMAAFPAETEGVGNPILEPTEVRADGTKVFDLVAEITPWERAPGDVVDAWTYNGVVPAPSIRLDVGDTAEFRLTNKLPIGTDLHLHGLNVENRFDGVAPISQDLIEPGETFTYEYTADVVSVAMYHSHFHSQVGVPNGLFGSILVGDLPLPRGRTVGGTVIPADLTVAQELPMVLNDSGVIGYSLNGKSFPATAPITGNVGDWILVHYFNEGAQVHPMHMHQFDQLVVAKDGYPLDNPYFADTINVAPGERYSVLIHLDDPGAWVWHCHILNHVEDSRGMFGMVTAVIVS